MSDIKKRIRALALLAGIVCLSTACFFLPRLFPYLEDHRKVFKQMRAWTMGARFVTEKGVVLQSGINDCGPASLKMIFAAYGIDSGVSDLSSRVRLAPEGASMTELRSVSARLGLGARSWFVQPEDLPRVPLPAIAFVYKNHFVVLRRFVSPEILEVDDPSLGRIRWKLRAFKRVWSGEMLVFNPDWTPL